MDPVSSQASLHKEVRRIRVIERHVVMEGKERDREREGTFSPNSSLECHYYGKRFVTQLRPPSFCRQTFKHIPMYIFQYVFLLRKLGGSGKDNEMMHMKACQKP